MAGRGAEAAQLALQDGGAGAASVVPAYAVGTDPGACYAERLGERAKAEQLPAHCLPNWDTFRFTLRLSVETA